MWTEELLNWIPAKSVPGWLNELTGTHSFIGHLEILQGASQKGKEVLVCAFLLPGLSHYPYLVPAGKLVRYYQN